MQIYEYEAFPVFDLYDEVGKPGGLTIPEDTFTQEELADLAHVTSLYEAWQARLKDAYWAFYWPKVNAETST